MFKLRLFITAVLLLCLFSTVAYAENWYIAGKAGVSFMELDDIEDNTGGTTEEADDTVALVGLAAGYNWEGKAPIRTELELAYRSQLEEEFGNGAFKAEWDVRIVTLMVNGYYDFDTGTAFTPYVGLGLGSAYIDSSYENNLGVEADKSVLTYAVSGGAGCGYALTDHVTLDLGYRYLKTGDAELDDDNGNEASGSPSAHEITLGLRYDF